MMSAAARRCRSARQMRARRSVAVGAILAADRRPRRPRALLLAPVDPARQNTARPPAPAGLHEPAGDYWLGTDELGRDLLRACSRARACRCSWRLLSVACLGGGRHPARDARRGSAGWVEIVIMRLVDIMLSIPAILLGAHGRGARPRLRQARPGARPHPLAALHTRRLRADAAGPSLPYITRRRTRRRRSAPDPAAPRAAQHRRAALSWSTARVRPDDPVRGRPVLPRPRHPAADAELGLDPVSAGRKYWSARGGSTPFPALCLFLLVLSVNVLGDWLRDRLDPRSAIEDDVTATMEFQGKAGRDHRRGRGFRAAGSSRPSRARPARGCACPITAPTRSSRWPPSWSLRPAMHRLHATELTEAASIEELGGSSGGRGAHPTSSSTMRAIYPQRRPARHARGGVGPHHRREPAGAVHHVPRDGET